MSDTNSIIIVGHLTRNQEVTYTNTGKPVGKFGIAVNEKYGTVEKVYYFDITFWGKGAEALNQYLLKGKMVAVTGKLVQDRWEKEGKAQSRVSITADKIQLLGGGQKQAEERGYPAEENETY